MKEIKPVFHSLFERKINFIIALLIALIIAIVVQYLFIGNRTLEVQCTPSEEESLMVVCSGKY
jgi:hypothetical protein